MTALYATSRNLRLTITGIDFECWCSAGANYARRMSDNSWVFFCQRHKP